MPTAADIAHAIDELLKRCGGASSICPSEVARRLWPQDWRQHMSDVREVALRGAIRLRRTMTDD